MQTASRSDRNLGLMIKDLWSLENALRQHLPQDEQNELVQLAVGYVWLNRFLVDRAVKAWEETPEPELSGLCDAHQDLDGAATVHSFRDIALEALTFAPDVFRWRGESSPFDITDDTLHMLDRLLGYGKYLADTRDLQVRWHPVNSVLGDPSASLDSVWGELSSAR
jgi:hypothetical protein